MAKKAGQVVIDINAGTAQFLVDVEKSNAALQRFGRGATDAGGHMVSSMQASSAAIRLLENPLGNNLRAVERFISLLPGMGTALRAAFPIVGALAFVDIAVKMGGEVANFIRQVEQAPQRISGAFRELNAPLKLTNDELALSNIHLQNEIAKIEGKPQNGLAAALAEARVEADKLAESLEKDLGALFKLLQKEEVGFFKSMVSGQRTDDLRKLLGGETGSGGFAGQINKILDEGGDPKRLKEAYDGVIGQLETRLSAAQGAQALHDRTGGVTGSLTNSGFPGAGPVSFQPDQTINIEETSAALRNLRAQRDFIALAGENAKLTGRRDGLQAGQANATEAANKLKNLYAQQLEDLKASHQVTLGEELRFWQVRLAQTASSGRAYESLHREIANTVGRLSQETEKLFSGESTKLRTEENRKAAEETKKFNEAMAKSAEEAEKLIEDSNKKIVELTEKTAITLAKKTERTGASGVEGERLSTERSYGQQLGHTSADEINLARQMAAYQDRITGLKIQSLRAEAAALDGAGKTAEAGDKRAEAEELTLVRVNDRYQAETRILEVMDAQNQKLQAAKALAQTLIDWQKIGIGTFEQDLVAAFQRLPQALGQSLVSGIFDRPRRGQTRGQAVAGAVVHGTEDIGKQLAGQLLTGAIEKLIGQLIGQTALAALQNSTTTANTAAMATLTAAVAANTAAQGVSSGVGAAGGAVGSAAGAASASASGALSGMLGPILGGAVGGVISGIFTLIGDRQLARHIDMTTAAVYSLRGSSVISSGNVASGSSSQQGQLNQPGSVRSDILKHFFGEDNSAQGTPVRIVGIGSASAGGGKGVLEGLFGFGGGSALPVRIVEGSVLGQGGLGGFLKGILGHFLGFADGTDSAPGGLAWAGERGPELINFPRGSQVIPNHRLTDIFGTSGARSYSPSAGDGSRVYGGHTFHIYEASDARETARQISNLMRSTSYSFGPAGSN